MSNLAVNQQEVQKPNQADIANWADAFLAANPQANIKFLTNSLVAEFGKNCGAFMIAMRALRRHQTLQLSGNFELWINDPANTVCLESSSEIITRFLSFLAGSFLPDLARSVALATLNDLRDKGKFKQLVFAQHQLSAEKWVAGNGIEKNSAEAIAAIMQCNPRLNFKMTEAAYLEAKKIARLKLRKTAKENEQKKIFFEKHLVVARQQDDGKSKVHLLAATIISKKSGLNEKMLVRAIFDVRKERVIEAKAYRSEQPFFDGIPNALRKKVKNPGSAKRKTKEKHPPKQRQIKEEKGKNNE